LPGQSKTRNNLFSVYSQRFFICSIHFSSVCLTALPLILQFQRHKATVAQYRSKKHASWYLVRVVGRGKSVCETLTRQPLRSLMIPFRGGSKFPAWIGLGTDLHREAGIISPPGSASSVEKVIEDFPMALYNVEFVSSKSNGKTIVSCLRWSPIINFYMTTIRQISLFFRHAIQHAFMQQKLIIRCSTLLLFSTPVRNS
jgi:hypothetical protein